MIISFTSAASTASPSTWRSLFLLLLRLSILDIQSPALDLLLSISMSLPSLLFRHLPTTQPCSSYYRKFICRAVLILRPLTDALHGDPKDFSWSPQMDSAFISAMSALALVPTLVHPDPSARVFLAVDASDSPVGAVFQQLVWGSWAPPRSSLLPRHATLPSTESSWLRSPP